jgi:hypothetical protein
MIAIAKGIDLEVKEVYEKQRLVGFTITKGVTT